jgi:hypothetical protein
VCTFRNVSLSNHPNILSHIETKNFVLLVGCLDIRFASSFHYYSSKQLLDDLKDNQVYWKLKEEALDRPMRRTCFGRGYGPVVRLNTG